MRKTLISLVLGLTAATAAGQVPGQNINMVSGTQWPGGDPFLQRQNEPAIAVSSRNPLHLMAGANDYRTVDLPGLPDSGAVGDAWLGVFKSFDGGASWQSKLLPGYPQDTSAEGLASPLRGFRTAADPVVRAGTHGLFYLTGIAFNRGSNLGHVFVARFIDLNNKENGDVTQDRDPIRYLDTVVIDSGTAGQFVDKPWLATDVPRAGASTCSLPVSPAQSIPGGAVYFAYARFTGSTSTKIMFARSLDCGATWSQPIKVSESNSINQGTFLAIDPPSGTINLVWRRFASSSEGDAILIARSTDFGETFSKAREVASFLPFDQGMTAGSFRTNSLPTMAVSLDGNGTSRIHVAWAQRLGPGGDARIVMATSANGTNWSSPAPVDAAPLADDYGATFSRGHQFMPQLTFSGGKLMLLYYDTRIDHTLGIFTPNNPFEPDGQGRFYRQAREPRGELPGSPDAVFGPFVDDTGLTLRRHTIDVRVAQAGAGPAPTFTSAAVSDYRFGMRGDETGDVTSLQQLQVNPPNFPLFALGTRPFIGDYIDINGPSFLPPASPGGAWTFNTASSNAAVHYAVWTSNQDVRPPSDGDWTTYTPVGGGGPSVYDPAQTTPACVPGREGMRNQNIYSSRITQGLHVSSPQNTKPLSPTLVRAFVVEVRNTTAFDKAFRLTIANQPVGGKASFLRFPADDPPVTTLDVAIPARSAVARAVFATSTNPTERIHVDVVELDAPGGAPLPSGLSSFVVLNPDPTAPALVNPDGGGGGDISVIEVYAPNISNPNVLNPNVLNPNVLNPNITNPNVLNPNISNPNVLNPDIADPNVTNPNVLNPNVTNPNISNPNVLNPNITNDPVSDATYTVANTGNTTTSYHVKLVGDAPAGVVLQLLLNKTYATPLGLGCELRAESQNTLLAAINNPLVEPPVGLNDPNIPDFRPSNATFWLRPGETALVTLRGDVDLPAMQDVATRVVPVLIPHPADPNAANPQYAAPLFITLDALAPAQVGEAYSATLAAIGGTAPYAWSATGLPPGLTLSSSGQISGTPTASGTFSVVVTVTDSGAPAGTSRKTLALAVTGTTSATALASSPNPSAVGQAVTFTATVTASGNGLVPTGTVAFREGTDTLGTAQLSNGSASLTLSSLSLGTHAITAAYSGDGAVGPSTSPVLTQTVTAAAPTYTFTGFFTPLSAAGTLANPSVSRSYNLGQAVPIKWDLHDAAGSPVRRLSTLASLEAVLNTDCAGMPEGPSIRLYSPTTGATGGSTFRFSTSGYIFNWDTSIGVATGRGCYSLVVQLDDGSPPKVTIVTLR